VYTHLSVYLSVCLPPPTHPPACQSIYTLIHLYIRLSTCSTNLPVCLFCLTIFLSVCLTIYLPVCLSIHLSAFLSIGLPVYLSAYLPLSLHLFVCLSIYLSTNLSVCHLYFYHLHTYLSVCLSVCRSLSACMFHLSIYLSVSLSIYLRTFPSVGLQYLSLSTYSTNLSVCLSINLPFSLSPPISLPTYPSFYLCLPVTSLR